MLSSRWGVGIDDAEGSGVASRAIDAVEMGLMMSEPLEPLLW
jgi:hypothetical protein